MENLRKLYSLSFVLNLAGLHFDLDPKHSKRGSALLIYSVFVNLLTFIAFAEELYCVILMQMPFFLAFFLTFCSMCYLWSWVKGTYLLIYRAEVTQAFCQWKDLDSYVCSELRETLLQKKLEGVMKSTKIMFGVAVAPYTIVVAWKICMSTLFVPTAFMEDFYAKEGPLNIVIYQCATVVLLNTTLVAYEAFLTLMVKLVLVEIEYLNSALERILEQLVNCHQNEIANIEMKNARKQLAFWLHHHAKVISFSNSVKQLFAPLVAGQYIFLIIIMCGLLYCSASGRLPAENASYCYLTAVGFTFLTFLACRQGDKVEEKALHLAGKEMPSTWVSLPSDIKKSLLIIHRVAQKPLSINVGGHVPLNSNTFRKMLLLQYKFYRFMADMH